MRQPLGRVDESGVARDVAAPRRLCEQERRGADPLLGGEDRSPYDGELPDRKTPCPGRPAHGGHQIDVTGCPVRYDSTPSCRGSGDRALAGGRAPMSATAWPTARLRTRELRVIETHLLTSASASRSGRLTTAATAGRLFQVGSFSSAACVLGYLSSVSKSWASLGSGWRRAG